MSNPANNFEGIHVSKGFVRGLQGQVLKLEQLHQTLIQQLEHSNRLATDYHASAVNWQQNYDRAMHEMEKTRQAHEREILLRISRESELEHFKNLLQEQLAFRSNSSSPSPDHPHHHAHEPMSPVSIPASSSSSSPRKSLTATPPATISTDDRHREYIEYIKHQLLIDQDPSPFDENDERVVVRDGKTFKQWVQYGFGNIPWYGEREMMMSQNDNDDDIDNDNDNEDNETEREFQTRYYYDSQSSRTTDCSGDPICHSDTDSN